MSKAEDEEKLAFSEEFISAFSQIALGSNPSDVLSESTSTFCQEATNYHISHFVFSLDGAFVILDTKCMQISTTLLVYL